MSLLRPYNISADDISGDVSAFYSESESTTAGVVSRSTIIGQNYSLTYRKALTRTITLNATGRYSLTDIDGVKQDSFFPVLFLQFTPPTLYNLRMGYNRTESLPSEGQQTSTTNTTLSFSLPSGSYWPSLAINLRRATSEDRETPPRVDSVADNLSVSSDYGFEFLDTKASLNYSFGLSLIEDKVSQVKTESPSHSLSGGLSRSFWDKKIKTSVSLGYRLDETTTESLEEPQQFDFAITPQEALSGLDIVTLTQNNSLVDGNLSGSVGIDIDDPVFLGTNLVLRLAADEAVHEAYIYIDTNKTKSEVEALSFSWEILTSTDGITWSSLGIHIPTYEEVPNKRLVFVFTEITLRYLRFVVGSSPNTGSAVNVTEMEAVGFKLTSPRQSFTETREREFASFSLSFNPNAKLSTGYGVSFDRSFSDLTDEETRNLSQSFYLRYPLIEKYLHLSSSYSNSKGWNPDDSTTGSNSYELGFSTVLLPTVRGSMVYRLSDSQTDGTKTSESASLSTSASLDIYEGVLLSLNHSGTTSKALQDNTETRSNSFSSALSLDPWSSVQIDVFGNYSRSVSESDGVDTVTESDSISSSFSYIPLRTFYIYGSFSIVPVFSQSYNVTWIPTKKIQTGARVSFSGDTTSFGFDATWRSMRKFSIGASYNGTRDDGTGDESDTVFVRASMSFR